MNSYFEIDNDRARKQCEDLQAQRHQAISRLGSKHGKHLVVYYPASNLDIMDPFILFEPTVLVGVDILTSDGSCQMLLLRNSNISKQTLRKMEMDNQVRHLLYMLAKMDATRIRYSHTGRTKHTFQFQWRGKKRLFVMYFKDYYKFTPKELKRYGLDVLYLTMMDKTHRYKKLFAQSKGNYTHRIVVETLGTDDNGKFIQKPDMMIPPCSYHLANEDFAHYTKRGVAFQHPSFDQAE